MAREHLIRSETFQDQRSNSITRNMLVIGSTLTIVFLLLYNINIYYDTHKGQSNIKNWQSFQEAILDYNNPSFTYAINFTDNLLINDHTLSYMQKFFNINNISGKEALLYCYGYNIKNNTYINSCKENKDSVVIANETLVEFVPDNRAIFYIHVHPFNNCHFSDKDILASEHINAIISLFCFDKGILWYDPYKDNYFLYNIEKEVKN